VRVNQILSNYRLKITACAIISFFLIAKNIKLPFRCVYFGICLHTKSISVCGFTHTHERRDNLLRKQSERCGKNQRFVIQFTLSNSKAPFFFLTLPRTNKKQRPTFVTSDAVFQLTKLQLEKWETASLRRL
jgi:hypothetical protein